MRGAAFGLLALALLAFAGASRATDYYACDCASGAEPGCRPGDDAGAGTSPGSAWRSYDRLLAEVAGSRCGDSFNFCRGGVFHEPGRSRDWAVAHQDCAARPRVVQPYDPGGVSRRPRIEADGTLFSLNAPGARGIVIRGLDLVCSGTCRAGVGAILGNVDEVLLDDLLVDGFNVCVQWGTNKKMGVRNSTIRNCVNQGLIGPAGDGSFVIDSRIENNGCLDPAQPCGFSHAHYWNVSDPNASLVVRNNRYEGNTRDASRGGACNGNAFVVRGGTRVVVEDNVFSTPASPEPLPGCMVVRMSTSLPSHKCTDCAFRRNRILGGHSLLEVESWIGGVIENNLLFAPRTSVPASKTGISLQPSQSGAVASQGLVIRNNSIAMGSSGGGLTSAAIDARHDPRFGPFGHGLAIVSNSIQMLGDGPNDVCFRFFDDAVVANLVEDYNLCGRLNAKARHASTRTALSLEEWRRAHPGQGVHSADADPDFAEPGAPRFDFSLGPESRARDAGDPARSAATDIRGVARPVGRAPDAGAEESGAAR